MVCLLPFNSKFEKSALFLVVQLQEMQSDLVITQLQAGERRFDEHECCCGRVLLPGLAILVNHG